MEIIEAFKDYRDGWKTGIQIRISLFDNKISRVLVTLSLPIEYIILLIVSLLLLPYSLYLTFKTK